MDSKPPKTRHFFKIVLSDAIQSGKLRLPGKFARLYGDDLPNLVHLKVQSCAIWPVELERCNGVILLSKGWPKFVDHYSIDRGYLLVFRYEGNAVFHVIICDQSTLEIQYPTTSTALETVEPKMEETDGDFSVKILDASSRGQKMRSKSLKSPRSLVSPKLDPGSEDINDSYPPLGTMRFKIPVHGGLQNRVAKCSSREDRGSIKEHQRRASPAAQVSRKRSRSGRPPAPVKVRTLESKSKHPSFHVVLDAQQIKKRYPYIPIEFMKENIGKNPVFVAMKFKGRSWPVKLSQYPGFGRLTVGWSTFARETSLSEGDACIFELIDRCKMTFEVSIFRSTGMK